MVSTRVAGVLKLVLATMLFVAASSEPVGAWPQAWIGAYGEKVPPEDFANAWGVNPERARDLYGKNDILSVLLIESSIPANILWPGDEAELTFQFVNLTDDPLKMEGKAFVIQYGVHTRGFVGNVGVHKIADVGSMQVSIEIKPRGFQDMRITPEIPAKFGGYAVIFDFAGHDRLFGATCIRTYRANLKPVQFHKFTMDAGPAEVMTRLGAAPNRIGISYKPTTDKDFDRWFDEQCRRLEELKQAALPVTVEFGGGDFYAPEQPLGRPRPWLDDDAVMRDTKFDLAWLPSYDEDFRKFVRLFVTKYGWPGGTINGVMLWNEPWEGISISGWGADLPRYREIYTAMALGVEDARKEAGVDVLIGGCDSSSNTFDKLFADGTQEYLKWLDFLSIHYQGMGPASTVKMFLNRKHNKGRVLIWDTESWVANSEDRVSAVIPTNYATGHDRCVAIQSDAVAYSERWIDVLNPDGKQRRRILQAWPVAAGIGAIQHMIGQRDFREILFKKGLPWVYVFDGLPDENDRKNPEDGTLVIVGDLGPTFGAENVMFRTVRGLGEAAREEKLSRELADAPPEKKSAIRVEIDRLEPLADAKMVIKATAAKFAMYDFYGNRVPPENDRIVVPLDARGFYLRADGSPGSFAALLKAVRSARIEGYEPLETVCMDMLEPIEQRPIMRLRLTNILNRPVEGVLSLELGNLDIEYPASLRFEPHETKLVAVKITGGETDPSNTYPLSLVFDAGADGRAVHYENLHVNRIARRTVKIDADLNDWKDCPPQTISQQGSGGVTLMEYAWQPFKKFDKPIAKGLASGYLAYDDRYFYFAAKVADSTPEAGMMRFETRDDDQFYYPEKSYAKKDGGTEELIWPEGVRRYSYRKDPELPSGTMPNHDNVQIAFNVLPQEKKPWESHPPGTMPGFTTYICTDYEYALNKVAPEYGGGYEIWRMNCPGMPRKHFYPRQPKSPYDGPVRDAALAVTHEGAMRVIEAAIPWTEIPDVKKRLDGGRTIKFSFRVNDNAGVGCMELARDRSVSKANNLAFHCDWQEHWANELEFSFEPPESK